MTARPSSRAQRARDPLELVSLRQLRYFSAAMRAPSFNEAARECSISQPALSEQIALLEQVLGVPLFDRTGGRAVPTLSGHELERRIAGSLLELQSALREVPERADTISGLVRVGLVQSYGACWVVPVMRAAQARWPALSVALRRRTAHALEEGVLRGDFEFAVSFDPHPHADLEIAQCFVERAVAVGALPRRARRLTLAQLAPCRLALLPSEYMMRRELDAAFASQGLKPQVRLESDALEDLVAAARESGMVAILNAAAASSLAVHDAVPIDSVELQRKACLVRSRTRHHTNASRHLWDALVAGAPALPSGWTAPGKARR